MMEAKDTVMREMAIRVLYDHDFWGNVMKEGIGKALQAQAEISFKAGEEMGYRRGMAESAELAEVAVYSGKQAEIEEVVEWVQGEMKNRNPADWYSRWQAKLKEWGIE